MLFSPRPVSRSSSSLLHGSKHGRRAPPMAPAKLEQPLTSHCSALLVSPQLAPFFPMAEHLHGWLSPSLVPHGCSFRCPAPPRITPALPLLEACHGAPCSLSGALAAGHAEPHGALIF
uniref:Uncharacterized protein n=1 Tax=Zea mays TaxID=4577 RepID=A0A804NSE1_MAIZE